MHSNYVRIDTIDLTDLANTFKHQMEYKNFGKISII